MKPLTSSSASAIILLSFSSIIAFSQTNFTAHQLSEFDGLPLNFINDIELDRKGQLWVSTSAGVCTFDGSHFDRYYYCDNSDTNALQSNVIYSLIKDQANDLWLNSANTLSKFDPRNHTFRTPVHNLNKVTTSSWGCELDKEGWIWIDTHDDLRRYDPVSGQIEVFTIETLPTPDFYYNIQSIYPYKLDTIWIANQQTLWRGVKTGSVYRLTPISWPTGTPPCPINKIIGGRNQDIWVASHQGVLRLETTADTLKVFDKTSYSRLNDRICTLLFVDAKHRLWVGERNRLLVYSQENMKPEIIELVIPSDLNAQVSPYELIEVTDGTYFLASSIGLWKLTESPEWLQKYPYLEGSSQGPISRAVMGILEDRHNNIWLACSDGITKVNVHNDQNTYQHFPLEDLGLPPTTGQNVIRVRSVCEDRDGMIWMGTGSDGLYYLDENGAFQAYPFAAALKNPSHDYFQRKFLEDTYGGMWMARYNGISYWNKQTNRQKTYELNPQDTTVLDYSFSQKGTAVFTVMEDHKGNIWAGGGDKQLYRYDHELDTFKVYDNLASYEFIFCLINDPASGRLFIGTNGSGLLEYDPDTKTVVSIYNHNNGLASATIYGMLADQDGNLWLAGGKGLIFFNLSDRSFTNYGKNEGVFMEEFNCAAYYKNDEGHLFFGGMGGALVVNPALRPGQTPQPLPTPCLLQVNIAGHSLTPSDCNPYFEEELLVPAASDYIELVFKSFSYQHPEEISYRYQLTGSAGGWSSSFKEGIVTFPRLSPGHHTVRIQVGNDANHWNEEELRIQLKVQSTIWQKTRFLLLGLLILSVFQFQKWYHKKRIELLQTRYFEAQYEAMKNQINPHFISNTLNDAYGLSFDDPLKANQVIGLLSKIINSSLSFTSRDFISVEEEISFLRNCVALEEIKSDFRFKTSWKIPEHGLEGLLIPPLITQIFIENAIIHGKPKNGVKQKIDIEFQRNEKTLCVRIMDNGEGWDGTRRAKRGRKSIGVDNVKKRLHLFKQLNAHPIRLKIRDHLADSERGASVSIEFPLYYKD